MKEYFKLFPYAVKVLVVATAETVVKTFIHYCILLWNFFVIEFGFIIGMLTSVVVYPVKTWSDLLDREIDKAVEELKAEEDEQ